jgi:RNA polymerase sigma factor (sigma-70 family)
VFDEANHQAAAAADASAAVAAAEYRRLIQAAVESFPDDLREVVVLRLANNLSFRQLADVMNEPTMTVSDRFRRALNALRSSLEHLT